MRAVRARGKGGAGHHLKAHPTQQTRTDELIADHIQTSRSHDELTERRPRWDPEQPRPPLRLVQPGFDVSRAPLLRRSHCAKDMEQRNVCSRELTSSAPRSCIATGTRKGYTITNCDPFGKVYGRSESFTPRSSAPKGPANHPPTQATAPPRSSRCCSALRSSPWSEQATVRRRARDGSRSSTPRYGCAGLPKNQEAEADPAHLWQRQSTICELTFPTTILAVKLNRRRLVVVLEERIYVYDISNMKLLHEIETSPNPNGEHLRGNGHPPETNTPPGQPSAPLLPRRTTATSRTLRRCPRRRHPSRPRRRIKRRNRATYCCLTPPRSR